MNNPAWMEPPGCQSCSDAQAPVTHIWQAVGTDVGMPGKDSGLLELTSSPYSQLNCFLSTSSKRTLKSPYTNLSKDPMLLGSQGKEAGASFFRLILLLYSSCVNSSVFPLQKHYVPSYSPSCPWDEDISLSGEIIPIYRINQVLAISRRKWIY